MRGRTAGTREGPMPRQELIRSAEKIALPSARAAAELDRDSAGCAAELTAAMLAHPGIDTLVGQGNAEMMEVNHQNQFRYLASLALLFDAVSLVETVLWVFRTYRARGFQVAYWDRMLPEARRVLARRMDPDLARQFDPLYDWLTQNVNSFASLSDQEPSFHENLGFTGQGGRHGVSQG